MASRKASAPSWQVILEEIRSQNRTTIEAVEAARVVLEQRIDRLDQETRSRDGLLERAIRENSLEIRQHGVDIRDLKSAVNQNSIDIRSLTARVEALARLEERVAALERRAGS
jgi:DNA repair ATPase RecN